SVTPGMPSATLTWQEPSNLCQFSWGQPKSIASGLIRSYKSLLTLSMKPWITTVGIVALCAALSAYPQGTFQNLGFEAATIMSTSDPNYVQFAPAFPGWTG